jgi:hypothetical protein
MVNPQPPIARVDCEAWGAAQTRLNFLDPRVAEWAARQLSYTGKGRNASLCALVGM